MASLLQLASRPRLQLLVLMLFLVAALFPEKTSADEEAPKSPGEGSEGAGAAPGDAGASGGYSIGTAAGRADEAVTCYLQKTTRCKADDSSCLKPDFDKLKTESCKIGYCTSDTTEYTDGSSRAERGCAPPKSDGNWVECVEALSGRCVVIDSTTEEKGACARGTGRADGPEIKKQAYCVCNKDKCNDRTSSGPTGAKPVGYSVALVGALLVAIFPLRTLFLVE